MKLKAYSKIILSLAGVAMCSGLLGGGVALRIQNQRQERQAATGLAIDAFKERWVRQLELSPGQREKILPVLDSGSEQMRAILTNAVSEISLTRKRIEAEIHPLLTPDQIRRLTEMAERREQLRETWQRGERLSPEQRQWIRERFQERIQTRTNSMTTNPPASSAGP